MHRIASKRDLGAAAVEFAIVLPVLLLIVLGIMEFGRAFYLQATMSGAAREGVREFAIHSIAGDATTRAINAAPTLGLSSGDVSISPGSCVGTTVDATVTITHHFNSLTGLIPGGLTLTGRGVMRCGA